MANQSENPKSNPEDPIFSKPSQAEGDEETIDQSIEAHEQKGDLKKNGK